MLIFITSLLLKIQYVHAVTIAKIQYVTYLYIHHLLYNTMRN